MIVDTSALIAILRDEPDAEIYAQALAAADLVAAAGLAIEAVTADQAKVARAAYRDFGKGSGHPAQLNRV